MAQPWIRRLALIAFGVACVVVILGAYTRLKDAGLGCPDWPGCYGNVGVPQSQDALAAANEAFPERPVEADKAWIEMIHRYFASFLGFLILVIVVLSAKARKLQPDTPIALPVILLGLVIFQGILGMLTVTLGLFPTVVMGHLMGGFTTLSLLFLLMISLRQKPLAATVNNSWIGRACALGIILLAAQIALGGWTAANYAATVCIDLPFCQPGWTDRVDFVEAFQFWGHDLNNQGLSDYEYGHHLSGEAKTAIHVAHRMGAIVVSVYLFALLGYLLTTQQATWLKRGAGVALVLLIAQIALGLSNVLLGLPLAVAVAHNGIAATLLLSLIWITYGLYRARGNTYVENPR